MFLFSLISLLWYNSLVLTCYWLAYLSYQEVISLTTELISGPAVPDNEADEAHPSSNADASNPINQDQSTLTTLWSVGDKCMALYDGDNQWVSLQTKVCFFTYYVCPFIYFCLYVLLFLFLVHGSSLIRGPLWSSN